MKRWLGGLTLAVCGAMALWAADDTEAAKMTRDERLMVKVTVDYKDVPIGDALKDLVSKIDDAKKGKIEIKFATGVSANTRIKPFAAKDKTVEEVLDGLLGTDLGYVVISKKGDKTDGGLLITKGTERGMAMTGKPGDKSKDKPGKDKPAKDKPEPKAKPEPKPKDPPKDPPSGDDKEKTAAQKLDLIKMLLDSGKKEKAKERLEELIKAFPDTKAAGEAKEMLEKLK